MNSIDLSGPGKVLPMDLLADVFPGGIGRLSKPYLEKILKLRSGK